MSISGVNFSQTSALYQQRRLDFKTLASAVQAGDTAAAQAALTSYQQDVLAIGASGASSDKKGSGSFATKIKTDFSNLAAAVQAGNITDAQAALTAYQQDRQAIRQGNTDQKSDTSSLVKDLTSLITSIQSGDATGEQSAADAVAKDLQSVAQSGGSDKAHHHHHHLDTESAPSSTDNSQTANATNTTTDSSNSSTSTNSFSLTQAQQLAAILKKFAEAFVDASQSTTQFVL